MIIIRTFKSNNKSNIMSNNNNNITITKENMGNTQKIICKFKKTQNINNQNNSNAITTNIRNHIKTNLYEHIKHAKQQCTTIHIKQTRVV